MRTMLAWMGVFSVWCSTAHADLDVAFVLDTTGSMGGELREAKERVVQISEALVSGRPGERVRLAIVAFRDRGDDYVTLHSDLSQDVEDSRAFLAELEAGGGGDGPEDVLSGLWVALDALAWGSLPQTDREIFLIGDAPAHLDYEGHVTPDQIVERARAGEHVIHAIGCRSLPREGVDLFRSLAYATEGSYQHIGAVRLEEDGADDLAGAVLGALSAESKRVTRSVALTWSSGSAHATGALHASLVTDGVEGCLLQVVTPAGLALAAPPMAALGQTGEIELRLALQSGSGERWRAPWSDCRSTASLHVQVEGD